MRHKTITLCPTTYEIARKMDNFSAWIRHELMKHPATHYNAKTEIKEKDGENCELCDVTYLHSDPVLLQGRMLCKKCGKGTTYLGLIE